MDNIALHIGFPKTGTTSLQRGFFYVHPDILSVCPPIESKKLRKLIEVDIYKDGLLYDDEAVAEEFRREIELLQKQNPGKVFMLSDENLCFYRELNQDRMLVAKRLFDIFGPARILITIRRQDRLICSLYQQTIQGGSYMSFSKFLDYFMARYATSFLPLLKYSLIIKTYEQLFGKESIKVLPLEFLERRPHEYFSELSGFLGVKTEDFSIPHENLGVGFIGLFLKRCFNWVVPYDLGKPCFSLGERSPGEAAGMSFGLIYKYGTMRFVKSIDPFLPFNRKLTLPLQYKQKINDIYADDNRLLVEEYGFPLEEYSYPGFS